MNTFMNNLRNATNYTYTENGALAHKTTMNAIYDMFALGGAYRSRRNEDCILLFKNALEENEELAMKCLFYLRDIRGGQGERRFFRVCFKWLCENHPDIARRNLEYIPEYGRWDDLIYSTYETPLEENTFHIVKEQLILDIQSKTPSLLGRWLPSENASSSTTKEVANAIRNYLGFTHKQYRKTLSLLRERIKVLERLMSANRWEEIEFDKIPSRAGIIYKSAFARRDVIAEKYKNFIKDKNTKVNAATLYPYEVVHQALRVVDSLWMNKDTIQNEREVINKYWENLPDYLEGAPCSMMCVVDTSGSMCYGSGSARPIDVAISLGMYCAERIGGPFKDYYISFSREPHLVHVGGIDFCDKAGRIYASNLCQNTNLEAVFDLLLEIAKKPTTKSADIPKTIVVISDMQIDYGSEWETNSADTEMEAIRKKWAEEGFKLPHLVYWNVDAREDTILDSGDNVTFVSGFSPVIFKSVLTGKTGWELCFEVLTGARYANIR